MTTGQKITELRKKNNITQEQLADLLSVSRQSVSKWESDIAYPETEKLISLSKIFKCSVDYLLKEKVEILNDTAYLEGKEETPQIKVAKKSVINKKGMPLSIVSMAFSLLTIILFFVPIITANGYVQGIGTISIDVNFYQIAFSSNYQAGNILFTLNFIILLSILATSILYLFFDRRALWISLKVLTTCFVFLYCLIWLLLIQSSLISCFIFAFLYLVYMILMWSIKPFRFNRKIK